MVMTAGKLQAPPQPQRYGQKETREISVAVHVDMRNTKNAATMPMMPMMPSGFRFFWSVLLSSIARVFRDLAELVVHAVR
jgi:hypothetical protein